MISVKLTGGLEGFPTADRWRYDFGLVSDDKERPTQSKANGRGPRQMGAALHGQLATTPNDSQELSWPWASHASQGMQYCKSCGEEPQGSVPPTSYLGNMLSIDCGLEIL